MSVTQKIYQANPGTVLLDIVDFVVNLGGDTSLTGGAELGNTVQLVDRATNTVLCSHYYWPTLFPQTLTDSMPLASDNTVTMPPSPYYLELQVIRHNIYVTSEVNLLDDYRDLSIALPGGGGGGLPAGVPPIAVALAAVAALSFVGIGVVRLRRGKHRR